MLASLRNKVKSNSFDSPMADWSKIMFHRYEHRRQPILSRAKFIHRMARNLLFAGSILLPTLLLGIVGYHYLADMTWLRALHNSAMILGGMGLVDPINAPAGILFSSFYALFCGLVFVTNFAIILSAPMHRIMHMLHCDDK